MHAEAQNFILVLGAQNDREGNLSSMARERALCAVEELNRRPNAKVVLTSSFGPFNQAGYPHAFYLAKFLTDHGVSSERILPFVLSTNTVEDAALSERLLRDRAVGSICVITSQVHVQRARLIFQHFFDPSLLNFVAAPDGVPHESHPALCAHEAAAIAEIKRQGGILFNGELLTLGVMNFDI